MATKEKNVTQNTIVHILDYIRVQKLCPGDLLPTEQILSESIGISRTILREAIAYLKGKGILKSRRGRGVEIAFEDHVSLFEQILEIYLSISAISFQEVDELRRTMELGVIHQSVCNANDKQIKKISDITKQWEQAVTDGITAMNNTYYPLDIEFHKAVAEPAAYRFLNVLQTLLSRYFDQVKQLWQEPTEEEILKVVRKTNHEHIIIANAFENCLPEVAMLCLREHLDSHHQVFRPYQKKGSLYDKE